MAMQGEMEIPLGFNLAHEMQGITADAELGKRKREWRYRGAGLFPFHALDINPNKLNGFITGQFGGVPQADVETSLKEARVLEGMTNAFDERARAHPDIVWGTKYETEAQRSGLAELFVTVIGRCVEELKDDGRTCFPWCEVLHNMYVEGAKKQVPYDEWRKDYRQKQRSVNWGVMNQTELRLTQLVQEKFERQVRHEEMGRRMDEKEAEENEELMEQELRAATEAAAVDIWRKSRRGRMDV